MHDVQYTVVQVGCKKINLPIFGNVDSKEIFQSMRMRETTWILMAFKLYTYTAS